MYRYSKEDLVKIVAARKRNKDKRAESRLYALELRAEGKSAEEVSAATGFHKAYISQLTAKYRSGGIEAISGNHYGGNRRNMSAEEEAALLEPFEQIWRESRKLGFKNEVFSSLDMVILRLCDTICSLSHDLISHITGRS